MTEINLFFLRLPLFAAVAFLLGAVSIAGFLLLKPGFRVDRRRRRPMAQQKSTLSSAADLATDAIDKVLVKRGSGLTGLLETAGVRTPAKDLVLLTLAGSLAAAAVGLIIAGPLGALAGLVVVPLLAKLYLDYLIGQRKKKFQGQLDEILQMMASSLRAGYSLLQALQAMGNEADSPAREEFTRVINETRVGRPLQAALLEVSTRMGSDDFYWVAQAIAINREVGGNLADVLDNVAHTIRERNQLQRQVAALSSEGKLSAGILMGLPFVVVGFISITNPEYLSLLFNNIIGWGILAAATVMLVIGAVWLRATVRIKY